MFVLSARVDLPRENVHFLKSRECKTLTEAMDVDSFWSKVGVDWPIGSS